MGKVAFSGDRRFVCALANNWEIGIWWRGDGQLVRVFEAPGRQYPDNAAVALSLDGDRLAFVAERRAMVWSTLTGAVLGSWPLPPGMVNNLCFPDASTLLSFRAEPGLGAGGVPWVCHVRDLLGPEPTTPLAQIDEFSGGVFDAAAPLDGSFFAVDGLRSGEANAEREVGLFDGRTGSCTRFFPSAFRHGHGRLCLNADGTRMAVNLQAGYRAVLLELPSDDPWANLPDFPSAISPDGERFTAKAAPGRYETGTTLLSTRSGEPLITLGIHVAADSPRPTYSAYGEFLCWDNNDGSVFLWEPTVLQDSMAKMGLPW